MGRSAMAGLFLLGGNMREVYKTFATSLAIDVLFIAYWAVGAAIGFYDENLVWFFISLFGMIINAVLLKIEIQDLISYIVHKAKIDDM